MSVRKDSYKIYVQENVYLLIFHKNVDILGKGVAVSLYIHNIEFLKFDCLGNKEGHYHIYNNNNRIFFSENTVEDQINKTVYELSNNIHVYLSSCKNIQLKEFKLNIELLKNKMDEMKNKMMEYENKYYSCR